MTRVIVAREGTAPFAGTFIERNCFRMPEGRDHLWVVWAGADFEAVGKATDFERDEETGAISFDIVLTEDLPLEEQHLALYANKLIESRVGDIRHVHEAVIRQITYLPWGGYPASREASRDLQAP